MLTVIAEEVLRDTPKYLSLAESGEVIVVTREGREVARIEKKQKEATLGHDTHDVMSGAVPVDDYSWAIVDGKRPSGLARGEFTVPEDFDAPLPDEILDAFEGSKASG